jgi:hypothetical protein
VSFTAARHTERLTKRVFVPRPTRVVQVGLGHIGQAVARLINQKHDLALVGGVDVDADLVGRDLGDVLGLADPLGVKVSSDLTGLIKLLEPDVAVVCTSSMLDDIAQQLRDCITAGINVVSTCEQLAHRSPMNGELWELLDMAARDANVSVLGTGVNPGFIMDSLPLYATAVSQRIDRMHLHRMLDASKRRLALQRKIGAGNTVERFHQLTKSGTLGHIGLMESTYMIADRLGWRFDEVETVLEPHIAQDVVNTPYLTVEPGQTTGVRHVIRGIRDGEACLTMELDMRVDAVESFDSIAIEGIPSLNLVFRGGIHGDVATRAITVNSIPRLATAPPGLLTMADIPIVHALDAV